MTEHNRPTRKRRHRKKRTVVDSASRNAATLSDGCNPELVIGADFDGIFEIPIIKKPRKYVIPKNLVPFSRMDKADPKAFAVCEYENDRQFRDLLSHPDEYIDILKHYQGFISPDCSLYRDMPLAIQITNIYRNRAIGYCFQKHDWHFKTLEDGSQIWTSSRDGIIQEGGLNNPPRPWNDRTGLNNDPFGGNHE